MSELFDLAASNTRLQVQGARALHRIDTDNLCECGAGWCSECDECSDYCICNDPPLDAKTIAATIADTKLTEREGW